MIIDTHCHVWARNWLPEKFWEGLAQAAQHALARQGQELSIDVIVENLFQTEYFDPDGTKLVAAMEAADIDKTVILPLDYGLPLGEAGISIEEQNEIYLTQLAQSQPDRFVAFASVDPRRPEATALVKKAIEEWGAKGLKLHPTTGFFPNEDSVYPLYELCVAHDIPVLTHTGQIIAPLKSRFANPIYVDDVVTDFPTLRIIMAHMSFGWWEQAMYMAATKPNLFLDCSGWQPTAVAHFDVFARTLRRVMDQAGSERVLFGTDGPAYRPIVPDQDWISIIKALPERGAELGLDFTGAEVAGLLGGNAAQVLKV